jgi:hypothetical protein
MDLANRLDQLAARLKLHDVTTHTDPQRFNDLVFLAVHGQEDDGGLRIARKYLARAIHAAEPRHPQVEDGDVRTMNLGEVHGLVAIFGLCNHLEPAAFEQRAKTLPHDVVIVGQKNALHGIRATLRDRRRAAKMENSEFPAGSSREGGCENTD